MLRQGTRFSLERSTLAVEVIDGKRSAANIPAGGIVEILPGYAPDDIMVAVVWEGRRVIMFAVDIEMRGTEILNRRAGA